MEDKIKIQKRIRKLIIVFAVVVIPALARVIDEKAFESVRNIDMLLLFISGFGVGALAVLIRVNFYLKNEMKD